VKKVEHLSLRTITFCSLIFVAGVVGEEGIVDRAAWVVVVGVGGRKQIILPHNLQWCFLVNKPNLVWQISHSFTNLSSRHFTNFCSSFSIEYLLLLLLTVEDSPFKVLLNDNNLLLASKVFWKRSLADFEDCKEDARDVNEDPNVLVVAVDVVVVVVVDWSVELVWSEAGGKCNSNNCGKKSRESASWDSTREVRVTLYFIQSSL